jgi:hypothetical protein
MAVVPPERLFLQFAACKPCFLREPKQRNSEKNCGCKNQQARAIDMSQPKELARKKGRKQERSAHPAAERQYDAVIQQARTARERAVPLPTSAGS